MESDSPSGVCQRVVRFVSRRPLAAILVATVACWSPYFSGTVVPFHDSAYIYHAFHCFYSEALFSGELARWIPYGNYGMHADLIQGALQPTAETVGIVGLLCSVRNTLVLAKCSVLLGEMLYVFGLYVLSGELYSRRLTRVLIALAGMLSVSWLQQEFLNLNVFYLLPLVLYLVIRFFKTGDATSLYLAGIVEICSSMGGVPYFAPLHALILGIVALPLCVQYPQALITLAKPRNLLHPWLWVMVAVGAVAVTFVDGGLEHLVSLSPDRDPVTGRVTQDTFLNYGRLSIATAPFGFITGGIPHGPNTYYVGLLPLAMFARALVTERDRIFVGLACAFGMLCWLSIGGRFTAAVYYLPGMSLFRHIGLVFGMGSMLLLLCSGYGFEQLAGVRDGTFPKTVAGQWQRWGWPMLTIGLMIADLWFCRRANDRHVQYWDPGWKPFFACRLLICGSALVLLGLIRLQGTWQARAPVPALILGLACLLDLASFRAQVFWTMPTISIADVTPGMFQADHIPWLDQRRDQPHGRIAQSRLQIFSRPLAGMNNVPYFILNSFARFDPCHPNFRGDLMSRTTYDMIRARGGEPTSHPTARYLPAHDQAFKASLGCDVPRIRLTRRVQVARSEGEAKTLFAALPDPQSTVVLLTDDPAIVDDTTSDEQDVPGTVQVTAFSSNRIAAQTLVEGNEPAWLVYADAWHPGWKATIDARGVPVVRANVGFKAVRIEPGEHVVEFVFSPRKRTWLAWCQLVIGASSGFILCALMLVTALRQS